MKKEHISEPFPSKLFPNLNDFLVEKFVFDFPLPKIGSLLKIKTASSVMFIEEVCQMDENGNPQKFEIPRFVNLYNENFLVLDCAVKQVIKSPIKGCTPIPNKNNVAYVMLIRALHDKKIVFLEFVVTNLFNEFLENLDLSTI